MVYRACTEEQEDNEPNRINAPSYAPGQMPAAAALWSIRYDKLLRKSKAQGGQLFLGSLRLRRLFVGFSDPQKRQKPYRYIRFMVYDRD
jgi:hypothetical protein